MNAEMKKRIYLDNAATTSVDIDILESAIKYFSIDYGNPSGIYKESRVAKNAIDIARDAVAKLINSSPDEIYFSGGGSESDNWALRALLEKSEKKHIITSKIEHQAILNTCKYLEFKGYKNLYVIGEAGVKNTLSLFCQKDTEEDVEAVVVGLDRELTYEKLAIATKAILNGAELIGTNPDTLLPTAHGFVPSNGGQVKYLEYATSTLATIIGKPSNIIMESAIKLFNYRKDEIVMVGDNYDTDIMSGINSGIDTIHVQTGVTSFEELKEKEKKPTYSIENLYQLIK